MGDAPIKDGWRRFEQCETDIKTDTDGHSCRAHTCTQIMDTDDYFLSVSSRNTTVAENICICIRLSFVGQAVCRDERVLNNKKDMGESGRPSTT